MGWGAILGIATHSASTAANVYGQQAANDAAEEQAEYARAFQREVLQNRYQWQMADMRAAGLNPILAYRNAAPGAPGAVQAPVGNIMAGVQSGVANAASTALAVRRQNQELSNMREQEKVAKAQTEQIRVNTAAAKLAVQSARAENARKHHEEAFWNTREGRIAAEASALQQAFPGSTVDQFFKLGLLGTSQLRTPDITPGSGKVPRVTLTPEQKAKIGRLLRQDVRPYNKRGRRVPPSWSPHWRGHWDDD